MYEVLKTGVDSISCDCKDCRIVRRAIATDYWVDRAAKMWLNGRDWKFGEEFGCGCGATQPPAGPTRCCFGGMKSYCYVLLEFRDAEHRQ